MGELTKEEMRDRLGNIDQIRDIIFGAQIREYTNRLDKLESTLSIIQQETRDRLEQVKTNFASEIRSMGESLESKLKMVQTNTQEETADLKQQVDRLQRKLTSTIESIDETMDKRFNSVQEEVLKNRTSFQDEIVNLKDLVMEELERRFSVLSADKLSREDMAETFFELGMRLKGAAFVPTLRDALDSDTSQPHGEWHG